MYTAAALSPSLRPWLSLEDGELLVEPLPGISFPPHSSREQTNQHLEDLAAFGVCDLILQQEDGATYFTIRANDESAMLVFDDDSDRLVAVVPITHADTRTWN